MLSAVHKGEQEFSAEQASSRPHNPFQLRKLSGKSGKPQESAVNLSTKHVSIKKNTAAVLSLQRKLSPADGAILSTSGPDFLAHQLAADFGNDFAPKRRNQVRKEWSRIPASTHSVETVNPIRKIVDVMSISPNPEKKLIKLHLGDPTITGTLNPHETTYNALERSLKSGKYNGYGPATGLPDVRAALAAHITTEEAPVTADDVILSSGCSHALQLAIESLANPGDNILVPCPGFPLYSTLMRPHGIQDRMYNLVPENNWEADLVQLESLIDGRTKAIIVNNPSNPCGAVFSKEHLESILKIADTYKVPIIADEIYGDMTYGEAEFLPMATLEPKVPILSCDGIAKRWLVPGWRLGWLTIHDRFDALAEVRQGLRQLATKIVGPCAVIQGALPSILAETPPEFFQKTKSILAVNASSAMEILSQVPGVKPVAPSGAMYLMVGLKLEAFPSFSDELEFTKALIAEESVYCLPGSAFHYPGAVRFVLTFPEEVTREACNRLRQFCMRHYREPVAENPSAKTEEAHMETNQMEEPEAAGEYGSLQTLDSTSPTCSMSSAEMDNEDTEDDRGIQFSTHL